MTLNGFDYIIVNLIQEAVKMTGYNILEKVLNNNPSPEVFAIFSVDENYMGRRYVAINPNTPVYLLEKLALDEDSFVRYYVADNPNTPANMLEKLALDEDVRVRYHVAP